MYLQMSLLSDITTPNGKKRMIQFLRGKKPTYPRSIFFWPNQELPSKSAWKRWFNRLNQIFKVENNGELPVSTQLKEWVVPINERQMIHKWYYSEIQEEIYIIKKDSITIHFVNEERYQIYSQNIDSSEKYNSLPEDAIPITRREGTTFKIDKQLSYQDKKNLILQLSDNISNHYQNGNNF